MRNVIETLRRVAARQHPDAATDAELLERFIVEGDEVAFAALVRRHGPMVLGVCRRILRHAQDAEDAFQATFLVLVRKASSIAPRERVGNWLYGVAQQTARKARTSVLRRQCREQTGGSMPEAAILPPEPVSDVLALVDRELAGLPATYRAAIVLCDLEGHSGREAARLLGWPEGTLFTRLARGRKLLADRLGRRGVEAMPLLAGPALGPGLVTTTVRAASATVLGPASAAAVVSPAVANLTEGVLQAMIPFQLKFAVVLVAVASLVGATLGAGSRFVLAPGVGTAPAAVELVAEEPPPRQEGPRPRAADSHALLRAWLDRGVKMPEADKAETIRRLYLDLTGTVPTPEILKLYLAEDQRGDPRARAADLYLRQLQQAQEALLKAKQDKMERLALDRLTQKIANQRLLEALVKSLDEETVVELLRLLERRQVVAGAVAEIEKAAAKTRQTRGKQAEIDLLDAIIKAAQEMKEKAQKQPAPKQ